jgi:uncharacterized protein (TIGR03437 family)
LRFLATFVGVYISVLGLAAQGIISTVAGNGIGGFSGDGGSALAAALNGPESVALDGAGNLYIADAGNHRIRRVDASGTIRTIAGNGIQGFSGDGGPATAAQLSQPYRVAVDGAGNLYIADYGNNRIRKVNTSGIISTVAGNGAVGFSGDGGLATSATLNGPLGVAVDSMGNIYLSDTSNQRVRKVSPSGIITTVAGKGTLGFSGDGGPASLATLANPEGLAVDSVGHLYISDFNNNAIRQVDTSGTINTLSTGLFGPRGVGVDGAGNLYIADTFDNLVLRLSTSGTISILAGSSGSQGFSGDGGPALSAALNLPSGVVVDSAGNLYIADAGNNRVRKVKPAVACSPTRLVPVLNNLGDGSTIPAGFPVSLDVVVADDCGGLINSGSVAVAFSNGDPPIALTPLQNGHWAGTWQPRNAAATVTLTFNAFSQQNGTTISGQTSIRVTLTTSTSGAPSVAAVTDGASFQANRALSPGTFITIFGSNLASSTSQASSLPLPSSLGGASIFVAGESVPIVYASPTQINAILPSDLAINTSTQLIVSKGSSLSTPVTISVAAASPGVFTFGQNQGILQHSNFTLVSSSSPAARGEIVVIYCSGLGATSPSVVAGAVSPSSPPAITTGKVGVTFGGASAQVLFAGLTPGLTGLYQINATVPSNSPVGNSVQLVINVAGIASVPVNVAVQ